MSSENDTASPTALIDPAAAKGRFADIPMVRDSLGWQMMPTNFGELVSFAGMMAKSGPMIRKVFRDSPGACLGIAMKASRWGFDPWDVANKSYFVNDQMCFEGQLIQAIVIESQKITDDDFDLEYQGEGDARRIVVSATIRKNGKRREYVSPPLRDIHPKNSPLWKSDPDQQLVYYGVTKWTRRWLPSVLMGVAWREELDGPEMVDVTPKPSAADNAARLQEKLSAAREVSNFDPAHVEREAASMAGETVAGDTISASASVSGTVLTSKVDYEKHLASFKDEVLAFEDHEDLSAFISKYGESPEQAWWENAPDDVQARATEIFEAHYKALTAKPAADAGDVGAVDDDPADSDSGPTDTELLSDLEDQCAACTTIAQLDGVFRQVDGPDGWYTAGSGDRRIAANAIINRHRERIVAAAVKKAVRAREEKIARGRAAAEARKVEAGAKAKADESSIDPELLAAAEAATKKGKKGFRLWTGGKLTQAQFDQLAPAMKRLEKMAAEADANL